MGGGGSWGPRPPLTWDRPPPLVGPRLWAACSIFEYNLGSSLGGLGSKLDQFGSSWGQVGIQVGFMLAKVGGLLGHFALIFRIPTQLNHLKANTNSN